MAHPRRPHTAWKNYHRYYSRNDATDKLDTREPFLFSRKLYHFICWLISQGCCYLSALVLDVPLGHRHAIRQ
jgi:hypothetical protein